ncbi:molybdenum cofactor biosynthesis protein MoaE [Methanomicrobium antiquum]|uniref:Molybdenum cofactor biosynthesis protein MoaE n=1 Tax=Methanomicrobium antiquum TaxID=487686 RepID=A0AAF0JMU0_9EURY|nr:molybdenum cofactor biosynthesis protein MoaE [Methanomicrobium antiquum]MDD4127967.1 molybdenum cofactor biosynthesis protein MoaE [Methanomicrobium sp.]WFN36910.1 molybdenum cofactor biosynthesis protein MoaE [Methanomicrobium antiquum]
MVIAITKDDIDIAKLISDAKRPQTGGLVVFVGTVRDDGIEAIDFESFDEAALSDLYNIADEAEKKFSLTSVDIIHRNGLLKVEETILVIVAGAGHRAEAFDGCRYILEEIKRYVPIWKKDIIKDGGEQWHA